MGVIELLNSGSDVEAEDGDIPFCIGSVTVVLVIVSAGR
jgi:hypothetical protein